MCLYQSGLFYTEMRTSVQSYLHLCVQSVWMCTELSHNNILAAPDIILSESDTRCQAAYLPHWLTEEISWLTHFMFKISDWLSGTRETFLTFYICLTLKPETWRPASSVCKVWAIFVLLLQQTTANTALLIIATGWLDSVENKQNFISPRHLK